MADDTNPGNKLNPTKNGTGDTDKIKLPQAGQTPPKIQLRAADAKKSTTRIDLADVIMPGAQAQSEGIKELSGDAQAEFFKKSTIRIESGAGAQKQAQSQTMSESKRMTMRIDGTTGQGADTQKVYSGETGQIDPRRSTIRISESPAGSETARVDSKRSTVRVDQPPVGATQQLKGETNRMDVKRSTIRLDGTPSGGETQQMDGSSATSKIGGGPGATSPIDVRKSTIRIDSIPQSSASDTQRTGTGGETKRIDLKTLETGQLTAKDQTSLQAGGPGATAKLTDTQQHKMKSETTRLAIPPEVAKRQTGRIQPVDTQEVFKKRTGKIIAAPVSAAAAPSVPAIAPVAAPTAADTVARPKTILVRRPNRTTAAPGAAAPAAAPVTVAAIEPTQQLAQRKSETARLDIPKTDAGSADDRPQTRPKTIRIKRPDGTTARKALTIARPEEGSTDSEIPDRFRGPAVTAQAGDDSPGGVWAVFAIAATLVLIGLVVYLLAQTHMPDFISSLPGHV